MNFITINNNVFGSCIVFTDEEGMTWFRAKDIFDVLGLEKSVLRRIDDEDRMNRYAEIDGNARRYAFVNEPGMYQMILASRKSEAQAFKKWITHEVLPSIRKNGGYVIGQEELAPAERSALEEQIRDLRAQVEKASAGKRKLAKMLATEEDRNFGTFEMYRTEHEKRQDAERQLRQVREDFSKVPHVERYLEALKNCRALDEQFRDQKRETIIFERSVKSNREKTVDPDPIMRDSFGNIGRLSELVAVDRS